METTKNKSVTEMENYQTNLLKDDEWRVSKLDQPWVINDGPSYAARSIFVRRRGSLFCWIFYIKSAHDKCI